MWCFVIVNAPRYLELEIISHINYSLSLENEVNQSTFSSHSAQKLYCSAVSAADNNRSRFQFIAGKKSWTFPMNFVYSSPINILIVCCSLNDQYLHIGVTTMYGARFQWIMIIYTFTLILNDNRFGKSPSTAAKRFAVLSMFDDVYCAFHPVWINTDKSVNRWATGGKDRKWKKV